MDDIGKAMRYRQHSDKHSSEFEKHIHDTLKPPEEEEETFPIIRYRVLNTLIF